MRRHCSSQLQQQVRGVGTVCAKHNVQEMQHQSQCLRESQGMSQCKSMSLNESGSIVTRAIAACVARIGISVGRKGYKSQMFCKEHCQVV